MSEWSVEYTREAEKDLESLDSAARLQDLKAIKKVSANPLPNSEGGYGEPLGNHMTSKLAGFLKTKLLKLGLRVVYGLVREKTLCESSSYLCVMTRQYTRWHRNELSNKRGS